MAVKAVIFDLFETLVSEYEGGVRKTSRSSSGYESRLGMEREQFRQAWNARQQGRMNGTYDRFHDVIRDILASAGQPVDDLLIEQLYLERVAEKRVPFLKADERVLAMLESLKNGGIRLALLSNCTQEEVLGWQDCALAPYFDTVVFSYQAGSAKPDRSIYNYCCSKLGVPPEECLFAGDGGSSELDGATGAGIPALRAVWFVPEAYRSRITGFPELEAPADLLAYVRTP